MSDFKIIEKHIDSRNRIVLPLKSENNIIFMAFLGSNIIIGKSEKELNDLLDNLKELEKQKKRSAFKSWFNLIEEAGLTNLTQEDIRNKHLSIIKERIGDI